MMTTEEEDHHRLKMMCAALNLVASVLFATGTIFVVLLSLVYEIISPNACCGNRNRIPQLLWLQCVGYTCWLLSACVEICSDCTIALTNNDDHKGLLLLSRSAHSRYGSSWVSNLAQSLLLFGVVGSEMLSILRFYTQNYDSFDEVTRPIFIASILWVFMALWAKSNLLKFYGCLCGCFVTNRQHHQDTMMSPASSSNHATEDDDDCQHQHRAAHELNSVGNILLLIFAAIVSLVSWSSQGVNYGFVVFFYYLVRSLFLVPAGFYLVADWRIFWFVLKKKRDEASGRHHHHQGQPVTLATAVVRIETTTTNTTSSVPYESEMIPSYRNPV